MSVGCKSSNMCLITSWGVSHIKRQHKIYHVLPTSVTLKELNNFREKATVLNDRRLTVSYHYKSIIFHVIKRTFSSQHFVYF